MVAVGGRFQQLIDSIVRTGEFGEDVADASAVGQVVADSERPAVAIGRRDLLRVVGFDHQRGRVRERHEKRSVGLQDSMDLSEHSCQVIDCSQGMDRNDGVEDIGVEERQVGVVGVVEFDVHFRRFDVGTSPCDLFGVGVTGHDFGSVASEGDGRVAGTGAKFQNAESVDVTQQFPVEAGFGVWPELHSVGRAPFAANASSGVAVPGLIHAGGV